MCRCQRSTINDHVEDEDAGEYHPPFVTGWLLIAECTDVQMARDDEAGFVHATQEGQSFALSRGFAEIAAESFKF